MRVPTKKIKHDDGYCVINESDFDPEVHELFVEPKEPGSTTPNNDDGDGHPTNEEMRAAIAEANGKAPHWNTGREKLIAQFDALNKGD